MGKYDTFGLCAAGFAVGVAAAGITFRAAAQKRRKMRAFVLLVTVRCKKGTGSTFVSKIRKLAAHCEYHEVETLSYKILQAREDEDKVFIYERYTTEAALGEVHYKSEAFISFKNDKSVWDLVEEKAATVLLESDTGYM